MTKHFSDCTVYYYPSLSLSFCLSLLSRSDEKNNPETNIKIRISFIKYPPFTNLFSYLSNILSNNFGAPFLLVKISRYATVQQHIWHTKIERILFQIWHDWTYSTFIRGKYLLFTLKCILLQSIWLLRATQWYYTMYID